MTEPEELDEDLFADLCVTTTSCAQTKLFNAEADVHQI